MTLRFLPQCHNPIQRSPTGAKIKDAPFDLPSALQRAPHKNQHCPVVHVRNIEPLIEFHFHRDIVLNIVLLGEISNFVSLPPDRLDGDVTRKISDERRLGGGRWEGGWEGVRSTFHTSDRGVETT